MLNKIDVMNHTETIKWYKIPVGKQSFVAKVHKIKHELEVDYWGNDIVVPYVYFNNIKILIDGNWLNIEDYSMPIKSKIGKRIGKLDLEYGDMVSFDAFVENTYIEFLDIENDNTFKDNNESLAILPKSYKDIIIVEIYETAFTLNRRLWKNNYEMTFDRDTFDKRIDNLNCLKKATTKNSGFFREVQSMYFNSRNIRNLCNLEKY